ncbi:hypothetical protein D3C83_13870 [compost metagenome]
MLGRQLRPVFRAEFERLELARLPLELLALGGKRGGIGFKGRAALSPLLPRAVEHRHFFRGFRKIAVGIEQFALGRRPRERLVLVLTVDVHQELPRFAQLGGRGRATVDEAARAARGLDHAPHQQHAVVPGKLIVLEPARELPAARGAVTGLEFSADFGALAQGQ